MSQNRFKVEVSLTIKDAETGELFSQTVQTWGSMSLKSVVAVEGALHEAQGNLLQQSIDELSSV